MAYCESNGHVTDDEFEAHYLNNDWIYTTDSFTMQSCNKLVTKYTTTLPCEI